MHPWTLRVLFLNSYLGSFKQDDAERQGLDSNAERVEPDKLRYGGFLLGFLCPTSAPTYGKLCYQ